MTDESQAKQAHDVLLSVCATLQHEGKLQADSIQTAILSLWLFFEIENASAADAAAHLRDIADQIEKGADPETVGRLH